MGCLPVHMSGWPKSSFRFFQKRCSRKTQTNFLANPTFQQYHQYSLERSKFPTELSQENSQPSHFAGSAQHTPSQGTCSLYWTGTQGNSAPELHSSFTHRLPGSLSFLLSPGMREAGSPWTQGSVLVTYRQPAGGAARLTQRALVSWVGCVPTASLPFITTELIPGNSSLQTLGLGEWEKELTERP